MTSERYVTLSAWAGSKECIENKDEVYVETCERDQYRLLGLSVQ